MTAPIRCAARLELTALPGIPVVGPGDDVAALLLAALERARIQLGAGDVLAVASKVLSRAEGRFVDLGRVEPSPRARTLAAEIDGDARLVELVLRESEAISRRARGVLVVRHRLGFVSANAGIDRSNAEPPGAAAGSGPWALLLPRAPDESAQRIRAALRAACGVDAGVVVTDSHGRPFRLGTVGVALGVAGLPALWDRRGELDLMGRQLLHAETALADQVAAAADLVAGQAAEGTPAVHIRGLWFRPGDSSARALIRPPGEDLYA
ncbi:MAG TPA: coenzyme F420-0:L-glutamate ligase [Kofleriaceae bacterium]|nr:coenzyme F420-0:L-glutamate ligase [Kofleriaceae bacterium]